MPYCRSCGRVISARKADATRDTKTPAKFCSARCKGSYHSGKKVGGRGEVERRIEEAFVGFLMGDVPLDIEGGGNGGVGGVGGGGSGGGGGKNKKGKAKGNQHQKGDKRVLVPVDVVEEFVFGASAGSIKGTGEEKGDGDVVVGEEGSGSVVGELTDGSTVGDGDVTADEGTGSVDGERVVVEGDGQNGGPEIDQMAMRLDVDREDDYNPVVLTQDGIDGQKVAQMSVRSGTRIRPPQEVSEVNGSVGGEKGWAERIDETEEMKAKRCEGQRKVHEKELVRSAARRGVVFGFLVPAADGKGEERRKCEAVMQGKVVEPSFAKGNWAVRWRE